jgi:hypothetical protein
MPGVALPCRRGGYTLTVSRLYVQAHPEQAAVQPAIAIYYIPSEILCQTGGERGEGG